MNLEKLFNIKNKVIIITGGSGFLGEYYIKFFKQFGANVVNIDIRKKPSVDITNESEVRTAILSVIKKYQRIDVLVNNASSNPTINSLSNHKLDYATTLEKMPLSTYKNSLEIDLVGSFLVSRTIFPYFKKQKKGVIINIGSVYGIVAPDQQLYKNIKNFTKPAYYSVGKAGIWGLTTYLASYGAPNIRVNQLTLGGIRNMESSDFVKRYSSKTMLKRMGSPEDIYGALLFLATDASSYMTGANLIVDGGFSAW